MKNYGQYYLTRCITCQRNTSKKYARTHEGRCKECWTGQPQQRLERESTREQRILEHGYQAYAREEGHYDQGDY